MDWACLQLPRCWLWSLVPWVCLPASKVCLITSSEIPPSPFIRNSDASLHFTEVHGGRFKEAAIYLPQPAPKQTPIALQFSNLREDKKYQEMMGLIEKDNLLLRQVPLGWLGGSHMS